MRGFHRHKRKRFERTGLLAVAFMAIYGDAMAWGELSGRFILTYQSAKSPTFTQEYFRQNYTATLKDNLWERSRFSLSFFLDDAKDLTGDRTLRRYWGLFNLSDHYWSLSARFSPKQKFTPLEVEPSQERASNEVTLDVRVPKAPRLRLTYRDRQSYSAGLDRGTSRDFRGDLSYQFRFIYLGLSRFDERSTNGSEREISSTTGTIRLVRGLSRWFRVNAGYDYSLSERRDGINFDGTTHMFNGLLAGRYEQIVAGSVFYNTRRFKAEDGAISRSTQETAGAVVHLFPASALTGSIGRRFLLTDQEAIRVKTDYGELRFLARGDIVRGTTGKFEINKRFDIATEGGIVPSDVYFLSLASRLYRGIEFRGDGTVSRKSGDPTERYRTTTVLDLFVRPRTAMRIGAYVRRIRLGERISLIASDRVNYGLSFQFSGRAGSTLGFTLGRNRADNLYRREETSYSFNLGLRPHERTSFFIAYGVDESKIEGVVTGPVAPADEGNRLNVTFQTGITRRGSISMYYVSNNVESIGESSNFSIAYRQNF